MLSKISSGYLIVAFFINIKFCILQLTKDKQMELITLIYIVTSIFAIATVIFLIVSYLLYKKKKKTNNSNPSDNIANEKEKEVEKQIEHISSFTIEKDLGTVDKQNNSKSPFQKVDNLEQKKKSEIRFN